MKLTRVCLKAKRGKIKQMKTNHFAEKGQLDPESSFSLDKISVKDYVGRVECVLSTVKLRRWHSLGLISVCWLKTQLPTEDPDSALCSWRWMERLSHSMPFQQDYCALTQGELIWTTEVNTWSLCESFTNYELIEERGCVLIWKGLCSEFLIEVVNSITQTWQL